MFAENDKQAENMEKRATMALVSDFDGTITDDDFFNYVSRRYLGEDALAPWREYLAGNLTHFEALREIFSSLRIDRKEFDDFIRGIPVDKTFFRAAAYCRGQGMPVYICSAGCDYYINRLIGKEIAALGIQPVTNRGVYNPSTGLTMTPPPSDSPFFDPATGISKAAVVRRLQRQGYEVVYCGDGLPDLPAAEIADVVFARKTLLERCRLLHIKAEELQNFDQVYLFFKGEENENNSPVNACPATD